MSAILGTATMERLTKSFSKDGRHLTEDFRNASGEVFARKIICVNRRQSTQAVENELASVRGLRHHHIVDVRLTFEEPGKKYGKRIFGIIMGDVADCNLREYLESVETDLPEIERHDLTSWIPCLGSGLEFIHSKNIRHKDIKPSNILIKDGNVFYSDFGIAKLFEDNDTKTPGDLHRPHTDALCSRSCTETTQRKKRGRVFSWLRFHRDSYVHSHISGSKLADFAEWRGQEGHRAYHLDPDYSLRWLAHLVYQNLIISASSFHNICLAALNPDPDRRVTSKGLKKWISCLWRHLDHWKGKKPCACIGASDVGFFSTTSLICDFPSQQSLDLGIPMSWSSTGERWSVHLKWYESKCTTVPQPLKRNHKEYEFETAMTSGVADGVHIKVQGKVHDNLPSADETQTVPRRQRVLARRTHRPSRTQSHHSASDLWICCQCGSPNISLLAYRCPGCSHDACGYCSAP